MRNSKKGQVTLIEIMVVIMIVAMLAAVAIPSLLSLKSSNNSVPEGFHLKQGEEAPVH
jgi:Tfp pilus assembly protein PilE